MRGSSFSAAASAGSITKASVKYALSDSFATFCLWRFLGLATAEQRVGVGCIASQFTLNLGEDGAATTQFSGPCGWALTSKSFAADGTIERGGLTSFPSQPTAPVTNGGIIPGFFGRLMVADKPFLDAQSASITGGTGNEVALDTLNETVPTEAQGGVRDIRLRMRMKDDDTTQMDTLLTDALQANQIDCILRVGSVPGSMLVALLENVQVDPGDDDDGDLKMKHECEGTAHPTAASATDEWSL